MNPPGRWKILVVDEHSQRLLSSVLKQFDVLEENVTRTSLSVSYTLHILILLAFYLPRADCVLGLS